MKYKNFEIKKVKLMPSLSEETECFSLDFYMDGKPIASVGNDGRGGCHRVHPLKGANYDDIDRAKEEMCKDEFLVNYDFEEFDTGVSTLLALYGTEKDLKKNMKNKACFIEDCQLMAVGYKGNKFPPDENLFEHVRKENPEAIILNTMDLREAAILTMKSEREYIRKQVSTPAPTSGM